MKVIDYKKVNINKINYHNPVKTAGGSQISKTFYRHNGEEIPIYIQTPRLKNISNLEVNDSKTFIELELDKKHINFYEFINNIDDNNITETHAKSEDWFEQKLPMDVIDDFYKTNIKMRRYNKAPVIKFKLPLGKNKKCDIFGDDLQPIDISQIKKNMDVICILELQGIKFFKQRFETEWNVVQLRAYLNSEENKPRECLIDESLLSDAEMGEDLETETFLNPKNSDPDTKNIEITKSLEKNKTDTQVEVFKVEETSFSENKDNISLEIKPVEESSVEKVVPILEELTQPIEESNLNEEQTPEKISQPIEEVVEVYSEVPDENPELEVTPEKVEVQPPVLEETIDLGDDESTMDTEEEVENNSDLESDNNLDNYYSDNFSDEEEICEGLENNLTEINFLEESEMTTASEPDTNKSKEDLEYQNKSIGELIEEINKLKKLAFQKDEEVLQLKTKYKNLYSELNL